MSFKKAAANIKRQRPGWWTQEGVLERLQAGAHISEVCRQASAEMAQIGITISPSRLRAEFSAWCESASWGEQLRAALSLWKRSGDGLILSKDWHDDFFAAMERAGGNAQEAAAMVDVGYGLVLALTDRRNKVYDKEFAERFRIAEMTRVGRIRERYMAEAEVGEGKGALRAQEKIIEAALPGLHGTRQEVHHSGKIDHEHEHRHGLSPGLERAVIEASQARVRRLTAGRQGLLPPDVREVDGGRVIDLVPVRQEKVS